MPFPQAYQPVEVQQTPAAEAYAYAAVHPVHVRRLGAAVSAIGAVLGVVGLSLWYCSALPSATSSSPLLSPPAPALKGSLLQLAEGGVGGCAWGVHCDRVPCCTEAGYQCVAKTQWWSACEKAPGGPGAAAAFSPASAPVAAAATPSPAAVANSVLVPAMQPTACAASGEDCTESKCCTSPSFTCKKRTDGLWWKSSCVQSSAVAPSPAAAALAAPVALVPGGPLRAETCGANIPDIKNVQKKWDIAENCARQLVSRMSLDDKLSLLHGQEGGLGFAGYIKIAGVEGSSGVVRLTFNDGPQGYNGYAKPTWGKGTQFPDLLAVAASFDPVTAGRLGAAIADEFRAKGCSVLLGPDVEVVRAPLSGRSFESLSGEDPYLGSELAMAYVGEVQRRGVIATVKHWLDNNQETQRQELDVHVDPRAQHEVYMLPFQGAVQAGAGAVMCSYNKVHGEYACGNKKLLRGLLREDLGFRGFVVSDWDAVHAGASAARAGLNVEMPEGKHFANLGSELDAATLDELAGGVLTSVYAAGQFHGKGPAVDWKWPPPYYNDVTSADHDQVARDTIIAGTVLLKNRNSTLPLKRGESHSQSRITMVGEACRTAKLPGSSGSAYSSGGSGFVATTRTVTPLEGLRREFGESSVSFSQDGRDVVEGTTAVICISVHSEEGKDREDLSLPNAVGFIQNARAQGAARIVMVAIVPGAITTEWSEDVDALLVMFMPGEQVGPALAQMLSGKASPAGRLPVSFPTPEERRFTVEQFPGVNRLSSFSEGVLVGYRWNDARGVRSAFPFGHGLSYTEFRYNNFSASCEVKSTSKSGDDKGKVRVAKVHVTVANMGRVAGHAVPQLYVGFKSLLPVVRQLRGFRKVQIPPGFQAIVTFTLKESDWMFYDARASAWKSAMDLGEEITVSLGSSSADLHWRGSLRCAEASGHADASAADGKTAQL